MKTNATLLGLAIGDALGRPIEFCTKDYLAGWAKNWDGKFIEITDPGVPPGTKGLYSDDTKMAICIAKSLIDNNGFVLDDVARRYVEWVKSGDLRGIGGRTASSIANLISGVSPKESGKKNVAKARPSFRRVSQEQVKNGSEDLDLTSIGDFIGNGTVMRASPIGVFF